MVSHKSSNFYLEEDGRVQISYSRGALPGSNCSMLDRKNRGFPSGPDQGHFVLEGCTRFRERAAPIGGRFRLRSLLRQDFFCRIRENFCHFFPAKHEKGPVWTSESETGPETCLFMPLCAAELRGGRAFARWALWKGVRKGILRGRFFLNTREDLWRENYLGTRREFFFKILGCRRSAQSLQRD